MLSHVNYTSPLSMKLEIGSLTPDAFPDCTSFFSDLRPQPVDNEMLVNGTKLHLTKAFDPIAQDVL